MTKKIALLCIAAAVVAAPAAAAGAATKVTVTATEFHFKLSASSVKHGAVTFVLVNKGTIGHDFAIAGKKTPVIGGGQDREAHRDAEAREVPLLVHGARPRRRRHEGHAHREVGGGAIEPAASNAR